MDLFSVLLDVDDSSGRFEVITKGKMAMACCYLGEKKKGCRSSNISATVRVATTPPPCPKLGTKLDPISPKIRLKNWDTFESRWIAF